MRKGAAIKRKKTLLPQKDFLDINSNLGSNFINLKVSSLFKMFFWEIAFWLVIAEFEEETGPS